MHEPFGTADMGDVAYLLVVWLITLFVSRDED